MSQYGNCNSCGCEKTYGYRNTGKCSKCLEEVRKSRRTYEKKGPHGLGRKPTCSTCGQLKGESYKNESRCKDCKLAAGRRRRAKKRAEKGLAPWGSKKNICYSCGKEPETKNADYCRSCDNEKRREARLKRVSTDEGKQAERDKHTRKMNDPEYVKKKRARTYLNYYVRSGEIIKKPCEVCGKEKVDAHHDDYMKPLEVTWLCRKHHLEHHKEIKLTEI